MNNKHTELLHKESCRLLQLQIDLLRKMAETNGLLEDPNAEQKQSMDRVRARNDIAVMEGELTKLEKLDMVLAVIGTMKSGKSTTNNAIVGLEVLPNRNRPMTALPTLIRHTPGQKTPLLRFENYKTVNIFIATLVAKLETTEGERLLAEADQQEDLKQVADAISAGMKVAPQYKMELGIFEFLRGLNDLVRLATALNMEFPFDAFSATDELPVIEVEFHHLRDSKASHGRLSLLDTPGPNEEGQFALKPMMKEQLRRASGVIAVLDYTQLKSESDAEVRRELLDIAEVAQGRLSIFVNKFDQKDRHSDDAAAIKLLVANELLKGQISEDDVYPVSSRYAYLANRARTELALHGVLPSPEQHLWVADFAEEGLGRRWQRDINDAEKISDAITHLWEDSLFEVPLERVIQRAHTQAAMLAIDSAASKLVDSGERINNFLGLRETALKKSAEELKSYITSLQAQQQQVNQLEENSHEQLADLARRLKKEFELLTVDASTQLKDSLEKYFSNGRMQAIKEAKEQLEVRQKEETAQSKGFLAVVFRGVFNLSGVSADKQSPQHFDPASPKIEFSDKRSARDLLCKIDKAIETQYRTINDAMLKAMDGIHVELGKQSSELEIQAKAILESLSARMKGQGFDLKLNLPTRRAIHIELNNQQILDDMVADKTRTVTRHRRQSGMWGTVCSWVDTDDWGWESYKDTEEYFQVDINKIRDAVLDASKTIFRNADAAIQNDVIVPVEQSCNNFFAALKNTIDEIRGDLLQGLADGNRSSQEQEDLAQRMAALKQVNSDSESDLKFLKQESVASLVVNPVNRNHESAKIEVEA
jgi:GTPase SAR1 family protein/HPt (histidine-containing phosphotransfer) domain-containing protein